MQRILNDPNEMVDEMLAGYLSAHASSIKPTSNPRVLARRDAPQSGRVGIVTGGGAGHNPAFLGYLGSGLVDTVAVGEVFSSPPARTFAHAIRAADGGAGVAVLFGNYAGDIMNVRMAREDAEDDGIPVATVLSHDDVFSAPPPERAKRRGAAGEVLMWKVGGAKAATGASLDEVVATTRRAVDNTCSAGIALGIGTIPAVGRPNVVIEPGTMEVGVGHAGEPGARTEPLVGADGMAEICVEAILPDLPFAAGDRAAVLVSGLGATPVMELYIFYARVAELLRDAGITINRPFVGNFFTSLDTNGVTLAVMKLDDELAALVDAPCASEGLTVL